MSSPKRRRLNDKGKTKDCVSCGEPDAKNISNVHNGKGCGCNRQHMDGRPKNKCCATAHCACYTAGVKCGPACKCFCVNSECSMKHCKNPYGKGPDERGVSIMRKEKVPNPANLPNFIRTKIKDEIQELTQMYLNTIQELKSEYSRLEQKFIIMKNDSESQRKLAHYLETKILRICDKHGINKAEIISEMYNEVSEINFPNVSRTQSPETVPPCEPILESNNLPKAPEPAGVIEFDTLPADTVTGPKELSDEEVDDIVQTLLELS